VFFFEKTKKNVKREKTQRGCVRAGATTNENTQNSAPHLRPLLCVLACNASSSSVVCGCDNNENTQNSAPHLSSSIVCVGLQRIFVLHCVCVCVCWLANVHVKLWVFSFFFQHFLSFFLPKNKWFVKIKSCCCCFYPPVVTHDCNALSSP